MLRLSQGGLLVLKHSKEDREEPQRKFKDKFNRNYDKRIRQYVADYEGTETLQESNSESESIDDTVEILVASPDSPPISSTDQPELFLTSFGPIPPRIATDVTNDLANRSFVHAMTGTVLVSSDNTDVDPFAYTTVERRRSATVGDVENFIAQAMPIPHPTAAIFAVGISLRFSGILAFRCRSNRDP